MSKCPLVPVGERLVVQRLQPKSEHGAGIVIPEAYRKTRQACRVVAVGPGRLMDNGVRVPPHVGAAPGRPIRVGDVVQVGRYNSQEEITIDGKEFCVIHSEGVEGVIVGGK